MNQDYNNHHRYVKGFHFLLSLLLILGTIVSIVNIVRHAAYKGGFLSSLLITLLFVCALLIFWYMRRFPLRAQDRAIRAEEGLRYFILTRKPIDSRITMAQIIALRFAPDEEFVPLVDRAAAENLSSEDIKKEIKQWRADHHRA
jgi:Family of unknown function (DUF6526)